MGINSAVNFTVQGNYLFGNTSWIGTKGPNCTDTPTLPAVEAFVVDANRVLSSNIQTENMATVDSADSLTCIVPSDGNYWPYGGEPQPFVPGEIPPWVHDSGASLGEKIALGLGIPLGIAAAAFITWYFRRWFLARNNGVYLRSPAPAETGSGGLGMRMANARKSVVEMVQGGGGGGAAGYQRQPSTCLLFRCDVFRVPDGWMFRFTFLGGPRLPASASGGSAGDPLL